MSGSGCDGADTVDYGKSFHKIPIVGLNRVFWRLAS